MRGARAKKLRREVYGPRSEWDKDGHFPCHPSVRGYTIMKTYQKIIPRLILADKDDGTPEEQAQSIKMPGADGKMYHYRYVPWQYNGEHRADIERRKYRWAKRNWKRFKKVILSRGW